MTAILERVAALEARIVRLEGERDTAIAMAADFGVAVAEPAQSAAAAADARPPSPAVLEVPASPTPMVPAEPVTEEILLILSAAVAAFLGERAHVRQARLLHSDAWAQQGRVSVMASHRWAVHR